MQVFKCAMRIIRGNIIFPIIYIVGLSFMGIFMAASFDFDMNENGLERYSCNFSVIDRDGSKLSDAIASQLAQHGTQVVVEDTPLATKMPWPRVPPTIYSSFPKDTRRTSSRQRMPTRTHLPWRRCSATIPWKASSSTKVSMGFWVWCARLPWPAPKRPWQTSSIVLRTTRPNEPRLR